MYIAFSALQQSAGDSNYPNTSDNVNEHEVLQRFEGYRAACEKYRDEIAAIQKYLPGWVPAFNRQ
ncbi:hypothetical protein ACEN9X_02480 [Mucilaginibacter sp. Mucisp86]|uniref:hypothetical protein n=1 Tax=Mucilaginibacter sp. Mucisp86 TaxID=3243060 RepID=UPI0039B404FB